MYYGNTVTETQLNLQINRTKSVEGIETMYKEDGSIEFSINEPNATLVLCLSMDDEGNLSIERVEAQPVVYLTADELIASSNGTLYFAWWVLAAIVAIMGGIFFILFKRRRKEQKEVAAVN
ncbi:MAG: LPXTG cell wall anchor domain-containing protein [Eubacteriales bacterium]|nr:LPXTG cell wall anchor domain-containing protein [Eubacteriales bacterium]